MARQYSEKFKKDAVRYRMVHQELGVIACDKNLGISKSALSTWEKVYVEQEGTIPTRGRGNDETGNRQVRYAFYGYKSTMDKPISITDYKLAHRLIFDSIEAFYNTVRIHSHCECVSPNDYVKE